MQDHDIGELVSPVELLHPPGERSGHPRDLRIHLGPGDGAGDRITGTEDDGVAEDTDASVLRTDLLDRRLGCFLGRGLVGRGLVYVFVRRSGRSTILAIGCSSLDRAPVRWLLVDRHFQRATVGDTHRLGYIGGDGISTFAGDEHQRERYRRRRDGGDNRRGHRGDRPQPGDRARAQTLPGPPE